MDDDEFIEDMVVTLCPDCGGEGNLGEELDCSNPDAFYDDFGRHVLPVDDLEDETGPDTLGLRAVGDDVAKSQREEAASSDPIGVVVIGQDDGLAHRVTRALGGVEGPFTEAMAQQVSEFADDLNLDYPYGVVMGKLWALVLPPMTVGYQGVEVMWLCKALGLEPSKKLTAALMIEAASAANPEYVVDGGEYEFDMIDWIEVLG